VPLLRSQTGLTEEILIQRGTTLVHRLRLEPSEVLPWHVDPYVRVTVVLSGELLEIEYQDGDGREQVHVHPGQVDWDEPTNRPHRARNLGDPYEEVTIFFGEREGVPHQPASEA